MVQKPSLVPCPPSQSRQGNKERVRLHESSRRTTRRRPLQQEWVRPSLEEVPNCREAQQGGTYAGSKRLRNKKTIWVPRVTTPEFSSANGLLNWARHQIFCPPSKLGRSAGQLTPFSIAGGGKRLWARGRAEGHRGWRPPCLRFLAGAFRG